MPRLVEVDDSAWPLVIVRIPPVLDTAAIESMFRGMDGVVDRKSRFAAMIDTRELSQFPNAVERKTIATWMTERTTAEALYNLGNAVVMTSPSARAVFTAIQWIRRPVTAHFITGTTLAGIDWCCMRLKQAGLSLPQTIGTVRAREESRAVPSTA